MTKAKPKHTKGYGHFSFSQKYAVHNSTVGLTPDEVKKFFGEMLYKEFERWMNGQTMGFDMATGQALAYPYDVDRFYDGRLHKGLDIWD